MQKEALQLHPFQGYIYTYLVTPITPVEIDEAESTDRPLGN